MRDRWKRGALTAVVVGIVTALLVAAHQAGAEWAVTLRLAPPGLEVSASTEAVRFELRV